jgi:transposase InsO family protein
MRDPPPQWLRPCGLRRAPARDRRHRLAGDSDRYLLELRLGRTGRRAQRGDRAPSTPARWPNASRALRAAGWRLERVLSDNGNEFRSAAFGDTLAQLGARHTRIRSGRPQTNGHVERLHRTILEECWRPAFARFLQVRFTGLRAQLAHYLHFYNHQRAHTGRLTAGRTPAELV